LVDKACVNRASFRARCETGPSIPYANNTSPNL